MPRHPVKPGSVVDRLLQRGYIAAPDAARMLGVHVITVYRWIDNGEIEGMKVFNRHFLLKTSLARKVGAKVAVIAGLVTEEEADEL